ncbi:MAG: hypothetical protein ACHQNT_10410 [Bacteroidia bacterium]
MFRQTNICFFLILFFFGSCKTEPEEKASPVYFDLKSFFENEADKMQHQNFSLRKTILSGDTTESHLIDSVSWINEFKSFIECDINRKAWINSYRVDSVIKSSRTLVKYSAKDSTLDISTVQIIFQANVPVSIQVVKKNDKQFYAHFNYLHYVPEKYFIIDNWQKINFASTIHIKIEGEIIKK